MSWNDLAIVFFVAAALVAGWGLIWALADLQKQINELQRRMEDE